jgi:hypothetical protein
LRTHLQDGTGFTFHLPFRRSGADGFAGDLGDSRGIA